MMLQLEKLVPFWGGSWKSVSTLKCVSADTNIDVWAVNPSFNV